MKKKRKSRKGCKNKPTGDEAKILAMQIHLARFSEPGEVIEQMLDGEFSRRVIERVLKNRLWDFAVNGGLLSEIDRALARLRRGKKSAIDKFVWRAWLNLMGRGCPTHDEICYEYCRITGKERTDNIARQVRRSVTEQRLEIALVRQPKLKDTK
jgi:hypothetical protein